MHTLGHLCLGIPCLSWLVFGFVSLGSVFCFFRCGFCFWVCVCVGVSPPLFKLSLRNPPGVVYYNLKQFAGQGFLHNFNLNRLHISSYTSSAACSKRGSNLLAGLNPQEPEALANPYLNACICTYLLHFQLLTQFVIFSITT